MKIDKIIRLSPHAREQLSYRGTSEEEITDVIHSSKWVPAELNRLECKKDFTYNQDWNNKPYKIKQVRPIFVETEHEIVVVTVYVYYF